jgi:hypothetical protein
MIYNRCFLTWVGTYFHQHEYAVVNVYQHD